MHASLQEAVILAKETPWRRQTWLPFWSRKRIATRQDEVLSVVFDRNTFSHLYGPPFAWAFHDTEKHWVHGRRLNVVLEFDWSIQYIAGKTHIFTNALPPIYSDRPSDVVCADSEILVDDDDDIVLTEWRATRAQNIMLLMLSLVKVTGLLVSVQITRR